MGAGHWVGGEGGGITVLSDLVQLSVSRCKIPYLTGGSRGCRGRGGLCLILAFISGGGCCV